MWLMSIYMFSHCSINLAYIHILYPQKIHENDAKKLVQEVNGKWITSLLSDIIHTSCRDGYGSDGDFNGKGEGTTVRHQTQLNSQ